MNPINNFHEDVQTLGPANNKHTDAIGILPLRYEYLDGGQVMVSCWRVTWRDLLRMLFTKKLYLCIMGERWPPLFIETDRKYTGIDEYTAGKLAAELDE